MYSLTFREELENEQITERIKALYEEPNGILGYMQDDIELTLTIDPFQRLRCPW